MNGWVNDREAGDLRPHCAHYDVTVMSINDIWTQAAWANETDIMETPVFWFNIKLLPQQYKPVQIEPNITVYT